MLRDSKNISILRVIQLQETCLWTFGFHSFETKMRRSWKERLENDQGLPEVKPIAAYAADEAARKGKKKVFPYWRVLKTGGELNSKYPGGVENLIGRLESEGHQVFQKGRRYFVQDTNEN